MFSLQHFFKNHEVFMEYYGAWGFVLLTFFSLNQGINHRLKEYKFDACYATIVCFRHGRQNCFGLEKEITVYVI